jgi:hypothetical protein
MGVRYGFTLGLGNIKTMASTGVFGLLALLSIAPIRVFYDYLACFRKKQTEGTCKAAVPKTGKIFHRAR